VSLLSLCRKPLSTDGHNLGGPQRLVRDEDLDVSTVDAFFENEVKRFAISFRKYAQRVLKKECPFLK
jgi:hypothetical protein